MKPGTRRIGLAIGTSVLLIIGIVIAAKLLRPQPPGVPTDGTQARSVTLRLKWVYDPGFAGEMIAAKKGMFESRGLRVELKPGGFEADPIKLVASGSDTFGVAGADTFLLACEQGVPLVAVAAGYIDTPVVFYVNPDSGIKSPADFRARRVGYQGGQDTATVYQVLIRKAGLSRADVTEIPVKYDLTPYLAGQVDVWPGYAATQSFVLSKMGRPYSLIVPGDYGVKYLGTVYFTRKDFAENNPEAVKAFVAGLVEGWQFTYSHTDEAVSVISSYDTKTLTEELVRWNLQKQRDAVVPPNRRFCEFRIEDFQATQQILLDEKLLKQPIDLSQHVSTKFLQLAYPQP